MMERNKQVLESANAAIAKGDYEGFLSYCTEDVWRLRDGKLHELKAFVVEESSA